MESYIKLLNDIVVNGTTKEDRTGTGTLSLFGREIRHNMQDGFPLLTTKKMYFKGIVTELLWFLRGDTNIKYLLDNNCHIWDGDCYKNYISNIDSDNYLSKKEFINKIKNDKDFCEKWGDLGPIYGKQWRNWGGVDQIKNVINDLKKNPDSRRIMVNAWNVDEINKAVLPPCHYNFQLYSREMKTDERYKLFIEYYKNNDIPLKDLTPDSVMDYYGFPKRKLSLKFNMRSADVPLGLPFNIASYALLLEIICKNVKMIPDDIIASLGDSHVYLNQLDSVYEQIERSPKKLPEIKIKDINVDDISKFDISDIELINYESYDKIIYPLSN